MAKIFLQALAAVTLLPSIASFSSLLSSHGDLRQPTSCRFSANDAAAASSSSSTTTTTIQHYHDDHNYQLDEFQIDFVRGYLNKHHAETLLVKLVEYMTPLGADMAKANGWSGGSYVVQKVRVETVSLETLQVSVDIQRRNKPITNQIVVIDMNADIIPEKQRSAAQLLPRVFDDPRRRPIDDCIRRLSRFCWMLPECNAITGKLMQLAVQLDGSPLHKLAENMYLNQVPHNGYVRQYFYDMATHAIIDAVVSVRAHATIGTIGTISNDKTQPTKYFTSNRLLVTCQFPELNPSMDSYRIGTLLELVRTMALGLATSSQKLRVRVCVQGSMGMGIFTGVPKSLSGVNMLLQRMDWQSEAGEAHEGIVGTYINFGGVGPEHVVDQVVDDADGLIVQHADDVFIVMAPQSMIGMDCSILPLLEQMVDRAGDRPVILLNPDLVDKPSAAGQQSVRGRQDRINFAESFETAFCFQNIYISGTSYFPILGAITKLHPGEPWIAHERRDYKADDGEEGEIYVPVLAGETRPTGEAILEAFKR